MDLFDHEMSKDEILGQQAAEDKKGGFNNVDYYTPWGMKFGQEALIRFVPHTTKGKHFLQPAPFHEVWVDIPGEEQQQKRSFLCLNKIWGEPCSFCDEAQVQYTADKEKGIEKSPLGGKLYHNKGYVANIKIIDSPDPYVGSPWKPIKLRESIKKKVYSEIANTRILDGQDPTSLKKGYDFAIAKTQDGDYASYDTSGFARAPSELDITDFPEDGVLDLMKLIEDEKPDAEYVNALLEAFMSGSDFDYSRKTASSDDTKSATKPPAKPTAKSTSKSTSKPAAKTELTAAESEDFDKLISDMDL